VGVRVIDGVRVNDADVEAWQGRHPEAKIVAAPVPSATARGKGKAAKGPEADGGAPAADTGTTEADGGAPAAG
jgi:hypothetical protein